MWKICRYEYTCITHNCIHKFIICNRCMSTIYANMYINISHAHKHGKHALLNAIPRKAYPFRKEVYAERQERRDENDEKGAEEHKE